MVLYHITLSQHQESAICKLSFLCDVNLIAEILIWQILIWKCRVGVVDMVSVCLERTLVYIFKTCIVNCHLTFTSESLVTHHGHHLGLCSSPVSTSSTNESINRIVEVNWFNH